MSPAVAAALKIEGWMSAPELAWLAEQASKRRRIVELGSHRGRSTKALAASTPGVVYAVDTWVDGRHLDAFRVNLAEELAAGKVIPQRQDSRHYIYHDPDPAEMVFIDANHSYDFVCKDVETAERILAPGGLLCGHDFLPMWPDVVRAVRDRVVYYEVVPGTCIWKRLAVAG